MLVALCLVCAVGSDTGPGPSDPAFWDASPVSTREIQISPYLWVDNSKSYFVTIDFVDPSLDRLATEHPWYDQFLVESGYWNVYPRGAFSNYISQTILPRAMEITRGSAPILFFLSAINSKAILPSRRRRRREDEVEIEDILEGDPLQPWGWID